MAIDLPVDFSGDVPVQNVMVISQAKAQYPKFIFDKLKNEFNKLITMIF